MHFHCHVIPRYAGDMDDPSGGIRALRRWQRKVRNFLNSDLVSKLRITHVEWK